MSPKGPKFTSREIAAALDIDIDEFHELRNGKFPELKIPATEGQSTRDQMWSAEDFGRIALLKAIEMDLHFSLTPAGRAELYRKIKREEIARVLEHRDKLVLLMTGFDTEIYEAESREFRMFKKENPAHLEVSIPDVLKEGLDKLRAINKGFIKTQSEEEEGD
jgi:hypothetical protein